MNPRTIKTMFNLAKSSNKNLNALFISRVNTIQNVYPGLTSKTVFRFSQKKSQQTNDPNKAVQITAENAHQIIDNWVKKNKVVLFMKGTPSNPQCGYSNFVVQLLKAYGLNQYKAVNILQNPVIREQVKIYSKWPTYPQLYIDGQLIGGSDILHQMHKDQSLQQLLEQKKLI